MRLLGKEVAELDKMYGCDCCSSWLHKGEIAVLLCYEDSDGCWHFFWECLDCQGVGV